MNKQIVLLWCLLSAIIHSNASIFIRGNNALDAHTFDYPISGSMYYPLSGFLFVGAGKPIKGNSFSLALANITRDFFWGITPEKVMVNGQQDQENPLHGASIKHLSLLGGMPLVVTDQDPTILYLITNYQGQGSGSLVTSGQIHEAHKEKTDNKDTIHNKLSGGVIGVGTNTVREIDFKDARCFAAIKNSEGFFGAPGSGIAVYAFKGEKVSQAPGEQEKSVYCLAHVETVMIESLRALLTRDKDVTFLHDVLNKPVVFHWSERLQRMYIGFCLMTGPTETSHAFGIIAGDRPCMAFEALTEDSLVGCKGAEKQISCHHITSMVTSTDLDYLMVVGGVGDSNITKRTIYAFPLVNEDPTKINFGMIAAKQATVYDKYLEHTPCWFLRRTLRDAIVRPEDTYKADDPEISVGGAVPLPGDIEQVFVRGDAVFVAINDTETGQSGIYSSQALFSAHGKIKAWTPWQCVHHGPSIVGGMFDNHTGSLWMFSQRDQGTVINKTAWTKPLYGNVIEKFFTKPERGVHNCVEVRANHVLDDNLLIMTGLKKCMIIKNSISHVSDQKGAAGTQSTNGVFTLQPTDTWLTVQGGQLENMGSLVAATVGTSDQDAWILLGGNGGLGVFAHPDGSGITQPDAVFKLLGNYRHVRKLLVHDGMLYVLTAYSLDRLPITKTLFADGASIKATTLAARDQLLGKGVGSFNDFIIAGDFALLATSGGLLSVGNNCSIKQAMNSGEVQWTPVDMFEGHTNVIKLVPVSCTGNEQDFATTRPGGNLYVMTGNTASHQSRVYRFDVVPGPGTNTTLVPFADYYIYQEPTFFLNFAEYHNNFITNGACSLVTRNMPATATGPIVQLLPAEVGIGKRFVMVNSTPLFTSNDAHFISCLLRPSNGSWLIAGDFGVRVNE